MKKWLKWILISLVAVVLLAFVGGAIFLLTFDPSVYKRKLITQVENRYHRQLNINGDLSLSLFPRIGLNASDITLSEPESSEQFLEVKHARLAVALWPLLLDRFLIDHADFEGMTLHIKRQEDGSFNFEDFFKENPREFFHLFGQTPQSDYPQSEFHVDIAGLNFDKSRIYYSDLQKNQHFVLNDFSAHTGHISARQPFDVTLAGQLSNADEKTVSTEAELKVNGTMQLDPVEGLYNARDLTARLSGRVGGLDLDPALFKGTFDLNTQNAMLSGRDLSLSIQGQGTDESDISSLNVSVSASKLDFHKNRPALLIDNFALNTDLETQAKQKYHLDLKSPDLDISPTDAKGKPLTGVLKFRGDDKTDANLSFSNIGGSAHDLKIGEVKVAGTYQPSNVHKLSFGFSANGRLQSLNQLSLESISGKLQSEQSGLPKQELLLLGKLDSNLARREIQANADAMLDNERITFKGGLKGFSHPEIHFDMQADELVLDDVIRPFKQRLNVAGTAMKSAEPGSLNGAEQSAAQQPGASTFADASPHQDKQQPEAKTQPAMQTASLQRLLLNRLSGQGTFNVGHLTYRGTDFNDFKATLDFKAPGVIHIRAMKAQSMGGNVSLRSNLDLGAGRASLDARLQQINTEKLWPLFNLPMLSSGWGNVDINLKGSMAADREALLQSLEGEASLSLQDGAMYGLNLASLPAQLAQEDDPESLRIKPELDESTDFSSLQARFKFHDGTLDIQRLNLSGQDVELRSRGGNAFYRLNSGEFNIPVRFTARSGAVLNHKSLKAAARRINADLTLKGNLQQLLLEQGDDAPRSSKADE